MRDGEYRQQSQHMEKLEGQKDFLVKKLLKERMSRITVESKLNKIVLLKELNHNYDLIEQNKFFEQKSNKGASVQASLSSSIKEQYKGSLSLSYAAKYAKIWIEKVRERREARENEGVFKYH